MTYIQISDRKVGENQPCFIIAEAGVNHNGDIELAKKLIDIAVWAGADAVKFQTWKTEELMTKESPMADYAKQNTDESDQFEMIKKLELDYPDFRILREYAKTKCILFMSTPDELRSANFLNELDVPALKIGSGELNNFHYLRQVAKMKKPIILSTGMGTLKEVVRAKEEIFGQGNDALIILHCTSDYPAKREEVNLLAMQTIQKETGTLVGYSDHTLGIDVPLVAVYLGACVVEKHFTYDKEAPGPDHKASLSPEELKEMIIKIRQLESLPKEKQKEEIGKISDLNTILGSSEKKPTKSEQGTIPVARKSVVAKQDIEEGTLIAEEMIVTKRPGTGIPADEFYDVIGKKTTSFIKKDSLIKRSDLI